MNNNNILASIRSRTTPPTPPTPVGAGIYRNSSLGLISLSSDGSNWMTIADRNLGAIDVGDDGYPFQWGNNHGFVDSNPTSSTQVDASNYGPYYYDDTYITASFPNYAWFSVENPNLWGGVTNTNEAMRGPCPEGFHVPSKNEFGVLIDTLTALNIDTSNGECMRLYLKMPYNGGRSFTSGTINDRDANLYYWSSVYESDGCAYDLNGNTGWLDYETSDPCASGAAIRPFKNAPVIPSDWDVIYTSGNGGIFHNPTDGLISLSDDGINRITIADKNLGATVVYEDGDTLDETNCGYYYQRGNNYTFPGDGDIQVSSTQVVATNYGPYYNNDTWIDTGTTEDWSNPSNDNLWGCVTNTMKAMQGPCPEGYHIPNESHLSSLIQVMTDLGITSASDYTTCLKIPLTGVWDTPSTRYSTDYTTCWLSCNFGSSETHYTACRILQIDVDNGIRIMNWIKKQGNVIRPFKNDAVEPDSTWTVLYQ